MQAPRQCLKPKEIRQALRRFDLRCAPNYLKVKMIGGPRRQAGQIKGSGRARWQA
jgi:hypothetical protein